MAVSHQITGLFIEQGPIKCRKRAMLLSHFFIQSGVTCNHDSLDLVFPRFASKDMYSLLQVLIGSLYCLFPLCLATVTVLSLVLRHSTENLANL